MKFVTLAAAAALTIGLGNANAEPVKVGMITTLSGGGAG
ncbi:ABC transporter substrate-binding protein, partial [Roseibium sp. FZY0029]|nr:ABC transporter substrate-binding protein [Roseibium sp. FZY0029]